MLTPHKCFVAVSCLLCCLLAPGMLPGQDGPVPAAEDVIEAYIDALGGEMNLRSVEVVCVTASTEATFGAPGTFNVTWKNGKFLVKEARRRAEGKEEVWHYGFDGDNEWTKSGNEPAKPRQYGRARAINRLERFGITPYALELLSFDGKVTQNGKKEVAGRVTWHLTFEWPNGQEDNRYFDIESGLLVRVKIGMPPGAGSGFGGGPPTREFNWHEQPDDGITTLQESRVVYEDSPDLRTQIESITFDNDVDARVFEIPNNERQSENDG